MRISELTTEQAADVLCEVVPYINDIATDQALLEELRHKVDIPEGASTAEIMLVGAEKLSKLVPMLLREKRDAVFGIVAVLNGKTAKTIAAQNILLTAKQVYEICKDKELIDFFRSCADADPSE